MNQRKRANSSKVNIVISFVFHSALIGAVFFFAGREGMLGKRLKEITVSIAPKEKKPEPAKEKAVEKKVEPPKPAELAKAPAPAPRADLPPPPSIESTPTVAPPSVSLPAFEFSDGAKDVQTTTDANELYKGLIERALRSRWSRPEDIQDDAFTAEIELSIDNSGQITKWQWAKGSGDKRWDDSVKRALAETKTINRPPPKGFPDKFTVRFDVESTTEPVLQANSR